MEPIQIHQVITQEGQITITGLPVKVGQPVQIIVLPLPVATRKQKRLTVRQLRQSGLIGLWKNRDDITDSAVYARQLREQNQQPRRHINYDFSGQ